MGIGTSYYRLIRASTIGYKYDLIIVPVKLLIDNDESSITSHKT